jgi:hypothetical protein
MAIRGFRARLLLCILKPVKKKFPDIPVLNCGGIRTTERVTHYGVV